MVLRARWVLLVSIVVGVGIWGYFLAQGRGSVPKYRTAVVGRVQGTDRFGDGVRSVQLFVTGGGT